MYKKFLTAISFALLLGVFTGCSIAPGISETVPLDPTVMHENGDLLQVKAINSYSGNTLTYYINGQKVASGTERGFRMSATINGKYKGREFLAIDTWNTNGFGGTWHISKIYIDGRKAGPNIRFAP